MNAGWLTSGARWLRQQEVLSIQTVVVILTRFVFRT